MSYQTLSHDQLMTLAGIMRRCGEGHDIDLTWHEYGVRYTIYSDAVQPLASGYVTAGGYLREDVIEVAS